MIAIAKHPPLLLARMASRPDLVRGPVLSPPCSLQRPFLASSSSRSHAAGRDIARSAAGPGGQRSGRLG